MTDNGSAYVSGAHRIACQQLGIRHLRTQPYRPAPTAARGDSSNDSAYPARARARSAADGDALDRLAADVATAMRRRDLR